jgi:hypothetical protein
MFKPNRIIFSQFIALCALVLSPLAAHAGNIYLTPVGASSFNVMARGLDSPAGFDIMVRYESARLSNPRVVQGSLTLGNLLAANTTVPGQVRFAIIGTKPMAPTGIIATINFDLSGDSAGGLTISGSAINASGGKLRVTFGDVAGTTNTASGGTEEPPKPVDPSSTTTSVGGPAGGLGVVGGTLTMPADETASRDHREPTGQPQRQESREATPSAPASGSEAAAVPEVPATAVKGEKFVPRKLTAVLDRFRLYAGDKTPANLMSLFQREPEDIFAQQPTVVLADGVATVTLTIPKLPGDQAPNFSFSKARFVGLRQSGEGEWLLEALPEKGVLRASASLIAGDVVQEIPLTVAPKVDVDLDKSGTVTEADFQLFLKTKGTATAPKYDLNGDSKRDYQDEFVFTANYLVQKSRKEAPAVKKP